MENLENIIEGILFIAGDAVEKSIIIEKLEITEKELDKAITNLKLIYNEERGIKIIEVKDKVQLCTNSKYSDQISCVLNPIREKALSRASLETVAIIAYKQPITRLEIENYRGNVNSDYPIQVLLQNGLIEITGKKDVIGRPLLFGTTEKFLKHFNLKDLSELPNYDDLMKELNEIYAIKDHSLFNNYEIPEETTYAENKDSENTEEDENETIVSSDLENDYIEDDEKNDKDFIEIVSAIDDDEDDEIDIKLNMV